MRHRREPIPTLDIRAVLLEITGQDIGTGAKVRCPYPEHRDRNASASVDHDRGLFKCFGCEKEGDSLSLLQDEYGLSFPEALERAKLICGVGSNTRAATAGTRRRRASDLLKGS